MSLGYKVVEVPVDGVELEVGETKYVLCFLFYLKVLRVAVWFDVKEVKKMLIFFGLYSLSISFCVILFIGVDLGFPKSCC